MALQLRNKDGSPARERLLANTRGVRRILNDAAPWCGVIEHEPDMPQEEIAMLEDAFDMSVRSYREEQRHRREEKHRMSMNASMSEGRLPTLYG